MLRLKRKGQSTAEYAIVIGLVIAAAVAMQVYVKRGLQAKIKAATDYTDTNAASVVGNAGQYEPYYLQSDMTGTHTANVKEDTAAGGSVTRSTTADTSTRTGTSTITGVQNP
jgi:hypothetical protein